MEKESIILKIKRAGLIGRGGAGFPVAKKWETVKNALNNKLGTYIIVNAAEGEPGIKKDAYLLENKAERVIAGLNAAYNFLGKKKVKKVYFYINKKYYRLYHQALLNILTEKKYLSLSKKLEFFIKPIKPSYISGEETAILNIIANNEARPLKRPPYPAQAGLNNLPTLIHNVETLFNISLVKDNKYQGKRLYTISGAAKHKGVYFLPANASAEDILRATDNYPNFSFFVILGGKVCGEVLSSSQLLAPVEGSGGITIFNKETTDLKKLLNFWLRYYAQESCGLCTPCREGTYRLQEMIYQGNYSQKKFNDLLYNLENATFCALGSSLSQTVKSYLENIYDKQEKNS